MRDMMKPIYEPYAAVGRVLTKCFIRIRVPTCRNRFRRDL